MEKNESSVKIGEELSAEVVTYVEMGAAGIVVSNDRELADANVNRKAVKALIKKIREWYKPHKDRAREALNGLAGQEKKLLSPLLHVVEVIDSKMAPYMDERARKQRVAEEAARRAEAEAEAAEKAAEEERQRLAREALQDGEQAKAEKILAKPAPEIVPEKVDIPSAPELEGSHATVRWTWEEEDLDKVPHILPNGKRALKLERGNITEYVQKYQKKAKIPGIRIFQKTGISSRL